MVFHDQPRETLFRCSRNQTKSLGALEALTTRRYSFSSDPVEVSVVDGSTRLVGQHRILGLTRVQGRSIVGEDVLQKGQGSLAR